MALYSCAGCTSATFNPTTFRVVMAQLTGTALADVVVDTVALRASSRRAPVRALLQAAHDGVEVSYTVEANDAASVTAALGAADATARLAALLTEKGTPINTADIDVTQQATLAAPSSAGARTCAATVLAVAAAALVLL